MIFERTTTFPEVERTRNGRHDNRQTKRRTIIRAGQRTSLSIKRVRTWTSRDRHRPDPRAFRARPQLSRCFPTQRWIPCQRTQKPRRHVHLDTVEILFTIFTTERQRERAELPRIRIRRPRTKRRAKRQRRGTRPTIAVPIDVELRRRGRIRGDRRAVRRQISGTRERPHTTAASPTPHANHY